MKAIVVILLVILATACASKTNKPTNKPTTNKPTTNKPTTNKPTTNKPTTNKPTTNKPTTNKPTTNKPTTNKPTTNKPTTNKPTTKKPTKPKNCKHYCSSKVGYVCANDGKTYINHCALSEAICKDKTKKLAKLHQGPCESVFGTELKGVVYSPVCASGLRTSFSRTYSHKIFVKLAKCLRSRYVRVKKYGDCGCKKNCKENVCDIGCPAVYNPVCGKDGMTYVNECALKKQSCILGGKLEKMHNGLCKAAYAAIVGIEEFKPIKGSDGNLYSSKAFLKVARCQNRHLKPVHK